MTLALQCCSQAHWWRKQLSWVKLGLLIMWKRVNKLGTESLSSYENHFPFSEQFVNLIFTVLQVLYIWNFERIENYMQNSEAQNHWRFSSFLLSQVLILSFFSPGRISCCFSACCFCHWKLWSRAWALCLWIFNFLYTEQRCSPEYTQRILPWNYFWNLPMCS